ncbi:MAG: hypothetical protein Q4B57_07545, partial [Eubacteriales bacterium]|nr:hypothetical protein [Eubacteriales bacterium]
APEGAPDMSQFGGEAPEGAPDMSQFGGKWNTVTVTLPVSVVVHTDRKTDSTFTILKEGDQVRARFVTDENGEEVITEIWME